MKTPNASVLFQPIRAVCRQIQRGLARLVVPAFMPKAPCTNALSTRRTMIKVLRVHGIYQSRTGRSTLSHVLAMSSIAFYNG